MNPDCTAKPAGTVVTNEPYANTLKALAKHGAEAFYEGEIAEAIAAAVQGDPAMPGDMTTDDLANYNVVARTPVCIEYRMHNVCGMGPPSSRHCAGETRRLSAPPVVAVSSDPVPPIISAIAHPMSQFRALPHESSTLPACVNLNFRARRPITEEGPASNPILEVEVDDKTRKGEESPYPFRSTRVFHANGAWYFSTREGEDLGPFPDRREADAALLEYLRKLATHDQRINASDG